ncbi:MAG: bifunctional diaminohydroxyphosphoribosylaminopyrimidine deaminase/5-amino-6-(5-phosphoribosylamino)uracil reductase RibD [Campylobacter sp.]|nr:bifunctional diaminohydroxyphosphoribosylaminopyrimidine deaminase/5-amino-6-(5-phosphoribosylamino)uracil reductase RibD [Campylobacter sp.]
MNDEFYMNLAISKAWEYQILSYPNPAVGALVLDKNGKILSIQAHKKAGFMHAEPRAIFMALASISQKFLSDFLLSYNQTFFTNFKDLKELDEAYLDAKFCYEFILNHHFNLLKDAKIYVSLEPCSHEGKTPSCAVLLSKLALGEVIIATKDENKIASGGIEILKKAKIPVKLGVLEDRARELLSPFLSWQRRNFCFFKLAISANGVASGGVISNELSRTHMHHLRSLCDLLVVGGNTVRIDKPRLDSRLVKNAKNPDVLIYSKKQNFSKDIALFSVPNRKVSISDELKMLDEKKLVMIEGAQNFLKLIKEGIIKVDMILIYQSSNFICDDGLKIGLNLRPLFSQKFANDTATWYALA